MEEWHCHCSNFRAGRFATCVMQQCAAHRCGCAGWKSGQKSDRNQTACKCALGVTVQLCFRSWLRAEFACRAQQRGMTYRSRRCCARPAAQRPPSSPAAASDYCVPPKASPASALSGIEPLLWLNACAPVAEKPVALPYTAPTTPAPTCRLGIRRTHSTWPQPE